MTTENGSTAETDDGDGKAISTDGGSSGAAATGPGTGDFGAGSSAADDPSVGAPTTGSGFGVMWAVARAELRRYHHRYVATRRKQALILVGAVAMLPLFGLLGVLAFAAGDSVAAGNWDALAHVARWWLPVTVLLFAVQGAFMTEHLLSFEARELLLSTVPDRPLALGLIGATLWKIVVYTAVPLGAMFTAFGMGAGSLLTTVVATIAVVVLLTTSSLLGVVGGLAARVALLRVPLSSDARDLYGTVGKVAVMITVGVVSALGGSTGAEITNGKMELASLAPSGPPIPLGYYADWLFVGTPLIESIGIAAIGSGLVVVAAVPLSAAGVVRLAPTLWYADPTTPDSADSDDGTTHHVTHKSFLNGGRYGLGTVLGQTGIVLDGLLRRTVRQPQRLTFVAYYLFIVIIMGVSIGSGGDAGIPGVVGGSLVVLGLLFAGALFGLNPLGEEGTMLGQLVLSDMPPKSFVRARLLAGSLVGAPLVTVGTALLAIDVLSPTSAVTFGAYWLSLVPASAGLALGLGTLLPNTETRRILEAIEVHAPETLAIVYHAILVAILALGGPLVATGSYDALVQESLIAALGVVIVVLGHGGYRFAVRGLADHGRPYRRDAVFTVELGVGLALAGSLLSTTAALGTRMIIDADGLVGFVAAFVGAYVGWATVLVAYLAMTNRTDYLDVRVPTRADLRVAVAGVTGLFGLWAVVTALVEVVGLPVSRHSIGKSVAAGGLELTVTLVILALALNGPVEELLFRNVIQKRLGEALDRRVALAVASILFALVHLPVYATGGIAAIVVSMAMLTALGGVLGTVYDHTGNIVVPALCHGIYNAALFVVLSATTV